MVMVIAFLLVALFAGGISAYHVPYCKNMVSISKLYDGNINPPPGIRFTELFTHSFAYSPTCSISYFYVFIIIHALIIFTYYLHNYQGIHCRQGVLNH